MYLLVIFIQDLIKNPESDFFHPSLTKILSVTPQDETISISDYGTMSCPGAILGGLLKIALRDLPNEIIILNQAY